MKKAIFALLLLLSFNGNAAHIIGGEVYYDYIGGDQYKITFEVYRDCNGSGALFDDPLHYTVFPINGGAAQEFFVSPFIDTIPLIYDDPCVTPPSDICVERGIYIDTITLPMSPDGYYISYQRCCWASNILNVLTPDDWGLTITTNIPGSNFVSTPNSAARFDNYPPIVLCSGQTLDFDHAAIDPDGDSLVYYMCDPLTVNISVGANPTPEAAGPYTNVPWELGFSGTQPFGGGSNVVINPQTGLLNITPNQIGTFVAAVCVDEYRDGILINTKSRTFGYRVTNCLVVEPTQVDLLGAGSLIEDCASAGFIVSRDDSTDAVVFQLFLSGTAINGTDYNFIPATLTMPIGVGADTILITPFLDDITEGDETLIFNIVVENICDQTYDTTTAFITIIDYIKMEITHEDSINVCGENGEFGELWVSVTNGVEPYSYEWSPTNYANNDTIIFPGSDLEPNLTLMYATATDQCGKMIQSEPIVVYNRCPLGPPNVITANGDGVNDLFIIKNIEDYDNVQLQIFNRWGHLVYENMSYQNDWDGTAKSGAELKDGVYTYLVTPESIKYIYDDAERTKYTAHGFMHIVRD